MGTSRNTCRHTQLLLIAQGSPRLRCRHCHLTISKSELDGGYCPECWDERGERRYDFDSVRDTSEAPVRYRCEICGVMLDPFNSDRDK